MAPQTKCELVFLKIEYASSISPAEQRITARRRISPVENKDREIADWISKVETEEVAKTPYYANVYFCEWDILTDDVNLLILNGVVFDKVYIILGHEKVYWMYYNKFPKLEVLGGFGILPVTYCSCCLDKQYMNILETIRLYQEHNFVK